MIFTIKNPKNILQKWHKLKIMKVVLFLKNLKRRKYNIIKKIRII